MKLLRRETWLLLLTFFEVKAFFFTIPTSTAVILNKIFTIECGTLEEGYILSFSYQTPPGAVISPQNSDKNLESGGRLITASFIVTEELNPLTVTCSAFSALGTTHKSKPATIHAFASPNHVENVSACQLDHYVFISWNKVVAIEGINITYRIMDNKGLDIITSTPYYSFYYNATEKYDYTANVSIIANATAANQISYSNTSYLAYKLNGM